jgi:aminoglycoside phosphotransferase (APT) family kinase protein
MIRSDETLLFLEAISNTITQELLPDLRSSQTRKSAEHIVQVLDCMRAQVRDGDRVAAAHLEQWRQLRQLLPLKPKRGSVAQIASAEDASAQASTGGLRQLESELALVQQRLLEEENFNELVRGFADAGSPLSRWYRQAIEAASDYWEAHEDSVQPLPSRSAHSQAGEDPEALRVRLGAYLARKYPGLRDDPIAALRIAAGGMTKVTALFTLKPNTLLPLRLVLRQDVAVNLTGTVVTDEYPIVLRLHRLGLKVPEPILVEGDTSVLGGSFMIMTEIADAVPAGTYFPKDRARQPRLIGPEFGRDAAEELARLHRLTAVVVDDPGRIAAAHRDGVEKAYQLWKSMPKPPNSVIVDLGFAWLKAHPLSEDRPRCLIHGDYSAHNMMARDGRLAGVLDWELAVEDDPTIDLAEARLFLVEDTLPWDPFVAAYLKAGGDPRTCDQAAVTYYCVWSYTVKYGIMLFSARNIFVGGARRDSLMASAASLSTDRILHFLSRSLKMTTQ